jgi:hypothetical protein
MTEEFLNIFAKIGKTHFQEQMEQTIKSFENMVHLFMDMPEKIDYKLDSIQAQINSLEEQISFLTRIIAEIQGNRVDSDPSRDPIRKVSPAEAKRDLMNELRDLLEKRKRKLNDND